MDNIKQQVVERIKQANNILITVKNDPTIDLLSSCLALSLLLDKLDKHATAVFSGEVPSAMEFLKPEETIEQTPNSLRDFIISLDKSKADKLRYKVEDKVVRIFITPYKSSLSQDDLEFSQGDLNVDLVIALGVHEQAELDEAVVAHGRILHDAGIISINNTPNGNLGTLNWQEIGASSVSEMIVELSPMLGENLIDEQIATALLTGIVAETARFSNDKTTPQTMRMAGELMAAGANQQLVANELQNDIAAVPHNTAQPAGGADDDTLRIDHPEDATGEGAQTEGETASAEAPAAEPQNDEQTPDVNEPSAEAAPAAAPEPKEETEREILPMPDPTSAGQIHTATSADNLFAGAFTEADDAPANRSYLIDQPAAGQTQPGGDIDSAPNPFTPPATPILKHDQPTLTPSGTDSSAAVPEPQAAAPAVPTFDPAAFGATDAPTSPSAAPASTSPTEPAQPDQTLASIEASVGSSHVDQPAVAAPPDDTTAPAAPSADTIVDARQQVLEALRQGPQPLETPMAFNAHPLGEPLHEEPAAPANEPPKPMTIEVDEQGNMRAATEAAPTAPQAMDMPLPPVAPLATQPPLPANDQLPPAQAPPAVPPPFMPPFPPVGQ